MKRVFKALQNTTTQECVNLADRITYRRPAANRKYDQIFMYSGDMIQQTLLAHNYLENKDTVFLGDGDGMSMMFGLFGSKGITKEPKSITVLDFDERMVNNIKNFSDEFKFTMPVHTEIYNAIDVVRDDLRKKFDYFYINPPYGSRNKGASTEVWLHRCMDLCKANASGCLVIPYDRTVQWTVDAMSEIQKFLLENGFVISDMITGLHNYHLDDNPTLTSATVFVDRVLEIESEYANVILPKSIVVNLYGQEIAIPKCIYDNGSVFDIENYDWEYGKKFW